MLVLLAAAGLGESRVRIVIITFLQHQVQVKLPEPHPDRAIVTRWTTALLSAPVTEGESIRTQSNSAAEVELECGSALRLAPQSELTFNRLRLRDDGVHVTTVTLARGEAFFTMQDGDSRDFHAHLGTGVVSMPDGGAKLRLDAPVGNPASVEVLNGQVVVQYAGHMESVQSRNRFEFMPGGGIRLIAMAKPDAWQAWSKKRDDAFQRAVLANGPKPPAQFSAVTSNPAVAIVPPSVYSPEAVTSEMKAIENKHPDPFKPRAGTPPPVPACAHR